MEEFRKKLEKQKKICGWISLISLLSFLPACIISHFYPRADRLIMFSCLMFVLALVQRSEINRALKNDKFFKKMYIKETDERNILIGKMSAKTALFISICLFALGAEAARIMGNLTAALTLIAAVLVLCTSYLLSMAYFRKKL